MSRPSLAEPPCHAPTLLSEALALRAAGAVPLAGGTDYYPARVGRPLGEALPGGEPRPLLDLTRIAELQRIEQRGPVLRIGATVTWSRIAASDLPPAFDGLRLAAREIGGRQIQNRGTIAGNLVNASPAADGVPPLLTLEARVELASLRGLRTLALDEFILGPRRTALAPDEIVTAVLVPATRWPARARFTKLGARSSLVISIAIVAGLIEVRGGRVAGARLAIGACSPTAVRLRSLEAAVIGRPATAALGAVAARHHLAPLAPIDDIRASAEYRRHAALVLVRRLLVTLGEAG